MRELGLASAGMGTHGWPCMGGEPLNLWTADGRCRVCWFPRKFRRLHEFGAGGGEPLITRRCGKSYLALERNGRA